FDCDTKRTEFKTHSKHFIVSPVNARQQLTAFLKAAKKELLIYDLKITDRAMVRILEERIRSGVHVRILGGSASNKKLPLRKLHRLRLHTRCIARDGKELFIGSQSLRKLELDARREIGAIVRSGKLVSAFTAVFEDDWKAAEKKEDEIDQAGHLNGRIKRVATMRVQEFMVPHVLSTINRLS